MTNGTTSPGSTDEAVNSTEAAPLPMKKPQEDNKRQRESCVFTRRSQTYRKQITDGKRPSPLELFKGTFMSRSIGVAGTVKEQTQCCVNCWVFQWWGVKKAAA